MELHPWLSTSEAVEAAIKAVNVPMARIPLLASRAGIDEMQSEALVILTECAMPPVQRRGTCGKCDASLETVRKGAKFCSKACKDAYNRNVSKGKAVTLPDSPHAHVGSMYTWPENNRNTYAVTEIGYALCNWLRKSYSGHPWVPLDSINA